LFFLFVWWCLAPLSRIISYNNILATIKYTLALMRSMFTQRTRKYTGLVPKVKLFTRYIIAHCVYNMNYSQTNASYTTFLINLIILTGNAFSISVFIDIIIWYDTMV
jgi:hypothetical protein